MNEILIVIALLLMLCLSGWQLALMLKLQMDVQKFGRLLRKLRRRQTPGGRERGRVGERKS